MNRLAWDILNSAPVVADPSWKYANVHRTLNALQGCDRPLRELGVVMESVEALKDAVQNGLIQVNLNQYPAEPLADIESLATESLKKIPVVNQGAIDYWTAVYGLALMAQGKA